MTRPWYMEDLVVEPPSPVDKAKHQVRTVKHDFMDYFDVLWETGRKLLEVHRHHRTYWRQHWWKANG